jgi:transposase InsO family protein
MNQEPVVQGSGENQPPAGGGRSRYKKAINRRGRTCCRYPVALKLKAVKLHLADGYSVDWLAKELGFSRKTLFEWLKRYRAEGEAGLESRPRPKGRNQLASAVRDQVLALKREEPRFGVRRIADTLKRWFCLGVSPETVRQTLHEAKLLPDQPAPQKRKRNVTRPRFFERATPNQLWQSDISTFRLGGKNAYLIGFLDDYSRYLVGLGLYRSQTAALVLEVYRRAGGEYGVPKEMLTDNGRQYASWRGNTAFQRELAKDKIQHIRSQPHHPMTLGKIERFWATIFQEYLQRTQFDTFEDAQERVALWVKYYNHRRPHQGIGGLCPADRYFEVGHELRQVLERQVKANVLELALRGKPQKPFYLVGRLDDRSVVLQAEKGKVVLRVRQDGPANPETIQEVTYDPRQETARDPDQSGQTEANADGDPAAQRPGEDRGGAGGVDRAAQAGGGVPGTGDQLAGPAAVAGPGAGGYVKVPGAPGGGGDGAAAEPEPAAAQAAGQAGPPRTGGPGAEGRGRGAGGAESGGRQDLSAHEGRPHAALDGNGEGGVSAAGRDHEGPRRAADGEGGGQTAGRVPQDLLRVGGAGAGGGDPGAAGPAAGPAGAAGGPGEGAAAPRGGGAAGGRRGDEPGAAGDPDPAAAGALDPAAQLRAGR